MAKKGRPKTTPSELRDGYYIELRNPNDSRGIKIRRDTEKEMQDAIEEYSRSKTVIVLGEYVGGKPVKEIMAKQAKLAKKAEAKAAKAKAEAAKKKAKAAAVEAKKKEKAKAKPKPAKGKKAKAK